jgi:hypothetical protein
MAGEMDSLKKTAGTFNFVKQDSVIKGGQANEDLSKRSYA